MAALAKCCCPCLCDDVMLCADSAGRLCAAAFDLKISPAEREHFLSAPMEAPGPSLNCDLELYECASDDFACEHLKGAPGMTLLKEDINESAATGTWSCLMFTPLGVNALTRERLLIPEVDPFWLWNRDECLGNNILKDKEGNLLMSTKNATRRSFDYDLTLKDKDGNLLMSTKNATRPSSDYDLELYVRVPDEVANDYGNGIPGIPGLRYTLEEEVDGSKAPGTWLSVIFTPLGVNALTQNRRLFPDCGRSWRWVCGGSLPHRMKDGEGNLLMHIEPRTLNAEKRKRRKKE